MVNAFYPETLKDALKVRKETAGKSLIICGGSDVMVVHKRAENVIFINQIKELQQVTFENGALSIGAGAVYSNLLKNESIPSILKDAVSQIASPAIRNVGTVAGNICNASPAGDTLPVLYALNAKVIVASLNDENEICKKEVPVQDFILGIRKIALKDDEIVCAINIEEKEYKNYSAYYQKVGARQSEAISKASFAALGKVLATDDGKKIEDVKFAFGSVGITVVRLAEYESEIKGLEISDFKQKKNELVEKIMSRVNPIDDQRSTAEYRKRVCQNLLEDFFDGLCDFEKEAS